MGLQRFIKQESGILSQRISFMLIFSGLATGALVAVINQAAERVLAHGVEGRLLLAYLLLLLLYVFTLKYSLSHTVYPLSRALYRLRQRLADKASDCRLAEFERLADGELEARLSHEVDLAAQVLPWVTYSAQAGAILLFSLIYLAWISFAGFLIVALTIAAAALWHVFVEKQMHHEFRNLGAEELAFSGLLRILAGEAAELRLNPARKSRFFAALNALSMRGEALKNLVDRQTISSILSTRIALFTLLAVFVFIIPAYDPDAAPLLFKITVITFFIMGPISQLVYALPLLLRLDSALAALYAFEARLDAAQPEAGVETPQTFPAEFDEIRLAGASFSYPGGLADAAPLFGEFDLSLRQGNLLFVHGAAGSGKTSLLKLLCGLYAPPGGTLHAGLRRVREVDYPPYRALFACALRDAPTPDGLYPALPLHEERVPTLLQRMGLGKQVEYRDGRFIHAPLSHHQRWRLSLVATLAQERPIYLFDDAPDAELEQWFYEEMLEELRGKGKTVVAVARDKRWLPLADKVLEIQEGGRIKSWLPGKEG